MQIGINFFRYFFYNLHSLSEASQSEWRVPFDFLSGIPVVPCKWQWLIQGRAPGALALTLLLDQTEASGAEKNFWETVLPYLRVCMTAPLLLSQGLDPALNCK